MLLKEKTIINTVALLSSLFSLSYAKAAHKDPTTYVMVGGYVGMLLGEVLADQVKKTKEKTERDDRPDNR